MYKLVRLFANETDLCFPSESIYIYIYNLLDTFSC